MAFVEQVLDTINNDKGLKPSDALYFERGFNFLPIISAEDSSWFLHIEHSTFLMIPKMVLERGIYNALKVPLTKDERKALRKAYDGWYARNKAMWAQRKMDTWK